MSENITLKIISVILPIAFYGCEIWFFFSCGLSCDALASSECGKGRIAVSDNLEGSDPAELLSWHLPAGIEERYRISQSGYPVSWLSKRASPK
jgi:hypothetical protein